MFNVYYVSFTLSSIFGDLWLLSLAAINPRSTSLVIKGEPKQDALILNVICKLQFSSSMNVLVDYIIQILGRTGPVIDWIPRKSCCWITAPCCLPAHSSGFFRFHCSGSSSLCILVYLFNSLIPQKNMSDSHDEDVFYSILHHWLLLT